MKTYPLFLLRIVDQQFLQTSLVSEDSKPYVLAKRLPYSYQFTEFVLLSTREREFDVISSFFHYFAFGMKELAWRVTGNIYWALLLRLVLSMVLFTICRIGFYLYNTSFFPDMELANFLNLMVGGLKFDLTAVLYVNLLFILLSVFPFDIRFSYTYQQVMRYVYFITNGTAIALNVIDFIYYKFTLRRTTVDVFKQFENESNITGLVLHFLVDYWYAVLFWIVLIVIMVKLYKLFRVWGPQTKSRLLYYVAGVIAMPIIAYVVVAGIRGGFRHSTRPITLSNAGEYVKDPRDISIVLNTPFTLIRTIGKTKVQRASYFTEGEIESVYTPVHVPDDTAAFTKLNVVIIILESFSKEFFGVFNRDKVNGTYKGYTPFLDSLIQHSRTYEYSFANGRKSIDGLPSVISSIPSLGVPYFLSPYSGNRINSVHSVLKEKGYHTSFFHNAPNGSMGFQAFVNVAGVENYFGMTEYGNDDDFDGLWGIWDHKFLSFYADRMNEFPQPFISTIFTTSSHHPFAVPEEFSGKFKGGPLPIHRCIEYTDHSLKQFFQKTSKMPWFRNTLFVITADHTSSNIQFDEHRTAWGFYSIPIIFYRPDNSLSGRDTTIVQQTDIMPSVLGYLHNNRPYVAFGRDVFRENTEPFAFNYKDNVYQYFYKNYLLMFDGTSTLGLYDFKRDKMVVNNLMTKYPDMVLLMERNLKALIQQYNNRLIDNKLTIDEHKVKSAGL